MRKVEKVDRLTTGVAAALQMVRPLSREVFVLGMMLTAFTAESAMSAEIARGELLFASFYHQPEGECEYSWADVLILRRASHDGPELDREQSFMVTASEGNGCTGSYFAGVHFGEGGALRVNGSLRSATFEATVPLCGSASDGSEGHQEELCREVTIDVEWIGVGAPFHSRNTYNWWQHPGERFRVSTSGLSREAEVRGTIHDGTHNYTPGPAGSALITRESYIGWLKVGPTTPSP